jgi:hypothetical protein
VLDVHPRERRYGKGKDRPSRCSEGAGSTTDPTAGERPPNQGKPWTNMDVSELDRFAKQNMPTRLIAFKMGRTLEAIYRKAKQKGISLKSTGQLPYGNQEVVKARKSYCNPSTLREI